MDLRRAALLLSMLCASPAQAQLPERFVRAPLTEVASAQVGAQVAIERYGLTGDGSTLCLVDTGVDPDAVPRARWLWDADGDARGHALEGELGGAVLDPALVSVARDEHGHGTAMASIATSLASDATLVVAAAYDAAAGGFLDDDVVAGIRFCNAVASLDDAIDARRMVILLSLGGHDGRHDGRGELERAIVDAAGDVPVVVAAGNDGERAVHAAGRLFANERSTVLVRIPRSALDDASVSLTLGFAARSDEAEAVLVAPDGARSAPLSGTMSFPLGGAAVDVEPRDGVLAITIGAREGELTSGAYTIEMRGSATFDVWLAASRVGPTFFAPALAGLHVIEGEAITIPATAPSLIAVGATVARPRLTDTSDPIGEAGEVAAFSSRGPTPDGAPKPDLVAPGGWILASLSNDLRLGDLENLVQGRSDRMIDGRVAVRGSSASAAMVAGALLLALELDPTRGPDARELLLTSIDEAGWTPDRGYGELDVGRLLARWSGDGSAPRDLIASRELALGDRVLWLSARGEGREITVMLEGVDRAERRYSAPLVAGFAQLAIEPGLLHAGETLRIESAIDGEPLDPILLAVRPDRHATFGVAGGGCTVAAGYVAGPSQRSLPGLWLILLAAVGRRSRGTSAPGRSYRRRRGGSSPGS